MAHLLDTKTSTFLALLGNGHRFRVPPFQRDYAWEEEQWEDLWADLNELRAAAGRPGSAEKHYMGSIVLESSSEEESKIIDGQQRLATLSIFVLAVIDRLETLGGSENLERAKELRARFIGDKDAASLVERPKLSLNSNDDAFFQDTVARRKPPKNLRGLSRSNRLLWDCFRYFCKILEKDALLKDGQALASLVSNIAGRGLQFIVIAVDDSLSAYTVFETLNARGLELSTTDLLKNYLFSLVKVPSDFQVLERRWQTLIGVVKQERFPEFLRFHLLCEEPRIRAQQLFKKLRARVRDGEGALALIDALHDRAELFAALGDASHSLWIDRRPCVPHVRTLLLFRATQITPLVFAAFEKLDEAAFARVLEMLVVITFRWSVVGGLNPNDLGVAYSEAAQALLAGKVRSAKGVFDLLQGIYVEDAKFERDFTFHRIVTNGANKKLAKYILGKIEGALHEREFADDDPATIEHVLPENPGAGWAIPAERHREALFRLGNLTLLERGANKDAGNAPYLEKRERFLASTYAVTRELAEKALEEWGLAQIDARQERLARWAVALWRIDFR